MPEKTRKEYGIQSRRMRAGTTGEEVRVYADKADAEDWYDYLMGRQRSFDELHKPILMERTITVSEWEVVERHAK